MANTWCHTIAQSLELELRFELNFVYLVVVQSIDLVTKNSRHTNHKSEINLVPENQFKSLKPLTTNRSLVI